MKINTPYWNKDATYWAGILSKFPKEKQKNEKYKDFLKRVEKMVESS